MSERTKELNLAIQHTLYVKETLKYYELGNEQHYAALEKIVDTLLGASYLSRLLDKRSEEEKGSEVDKGC
jgi:hypothetical protein